MLRGVIFDWDGVVVDSSAAHEESWNLLAKETGRILPEGHFKKGFGRKNAYIIPEILGWSDDPEEIQALGDRKEALYRDLLGDGGLKLLPGAKELVRSLAHAGIPTVIGTSTPRANIEHALCLLEMEDAFQAAVTAEDVTEGKPNPEVFLKAAQAINVAPAQCVVFEDAVYGVEAALGGGMKAVAVLTTHGPESFTMAHKVVQSLADVDIPALQELFK